MTREEFHNQFPELKQNYKPNFDVSKHISQLTLLMVIGPSGVGKSTVMKQLGYTYVPSDTTRLKTESEIDGVDYIFRQDYDQLFKEIQDGQFVQFVVGPAGEFYGTKDSSYPPFGIAMMAVVAKEIENFRSLGFGQTISAFITPQSFDEWMKRFDSYRSLTSGKREHRLIEGGQSLGMSLSDDQTHFILNDQVADAVQQIQSLVAGKTDAWRENAAHESAREMLDGID
jgi:guanylate kinase